jgi:hypothetical protein
MAVSHEHAVEVDSRLAQLWEEEFDLQRTLKWKIDAVHQAIGERRERDRNWNNLPWPSSTTEAVSTARARAEYAPDKYPSGYDKDVWDAIKCRDVVAEFDKAHEALDANQAAQEPLHAEYLAHRWSRFFLVRNVGGHIHSSRSCSTTFPTTQWAWLPTLSGLGEADAVAAEGTRLCSICYPTAPVEWTVGLPKVVDPTVCTGSGLPAVIVERQGERWNRQTWKDEPYTYGAKTCQVCGRSDLTFKGEMLTASKHKVPKVKKGKG